jgi:hypothetical protein
MRNRSETILNFSEHQILQEADFPSGNERTLGKIKIAIFYSRFFEGDREESFTGWWAVKWPKLS